MHPLHFMADAREIVDGRELAARARRAEATGYHALVIPDHLIPQLSPAVAMAWIAEATERLRVAAFVFNNDLRHPAILAQDLASLDVLSGGRLDVAIGAGWNKPEYDAIGLPFDPPPVRQARLIEAIAVSSSNRPRSSSARSPRSRRSSAASARSSGSARSWSASWVPSTRSWSGWRGHSTRESGGHGARRRGRRVLPGC